MFHYSGDLRGLIDPNMTPSQFCKVVCDSLLLCRSVKCSSCGMGTDEEVTCNQLESASGSQGPYELDVSCSEGPKSSTGIPGWLVIVWRSRGALHFELHFDELQHPVRMIDFWQAIGKLGILHVTHTNRAATIDEHPARLIPKFITAEEQRYAN